MSVNTTYNAKMCKTVSVFSFIPQMSNYSMLTRHVTVDLYTKTLTEQLARNIKTVTKKKILK